VGRVWADDITAREPLDDVFVVRRAQVSRWFWKRVGVLRADAIDASFAAARRSTTWQH
jgi:hypothetical protein